MPRATLLSLLIVPTFLAAQNGMESGDLAQSAGPGAVPDELVHFQSGILALKGDRPGEAITHFTRDLAAHPGNAKAWYYRGVCHSAVGDNRSALSDLDRALELAPGDANALLRRSEAHQAIGSFDAVKADLNRVLNMHQEGPVAEHALMSLGETHMRLGEYATAITVYDRFVAIAPNDARSWYNRGVAHAHTGSHQAAHDDLSRAIEADGWMYRAYAARAVEKVYLDRKGEACADLMRARELGDSNVEDLLVIYCD